MISFIDVASILQRVILPLLEARDLAALACTSRELKQLAYDQPASVWEAAARSVPCVRSARSTSFVALNTFNSRCLADQCCKLVSPGLGLDSLACCSGAAKRLLAQSHPSIQRPARICFSKQVRHL